MHPRVILLEFNELSPALLDRWMVAGELPNFARLHAASDIFQTDADVDDPGQLEPWIQWYSVHTGLAFDQHRVFHLTDGARAAHDDIYRVLLAAGKRVGSAASMNVRAFQAPGSFYFGDPWTANDDASPPELDAYNRFVGRQVREYSNAQAPAAFGDTAKFVAFMLRHGLDASTIGAILSQLARERFGDRRHAYRRAALLDRFQYHVFDTLVRRHRPDFASFFINSTAHLQHSYWRHHDPAAFEVRPEPGEVAIYGDAIRIGYRAMDGLVGRFLKLADATDARLVFMTALSQQPFTRLEAIGGQNFYRLHDIDAALDRLKIVRLAAAPMMTHQYMLRFVNDAQATAARTRLAALHLDCGRQLFDFADRAGAGPTLYFGCQIATRTDAGTVVIDEATGDRLRFGDLFYRIDAIKSGCHHPRGTLWIGGGDRKSVV